MTEYLFFTENGPFDDGEGNDVSLGEHLDYLETYGGTPDCFNSFKGTRNQAIEAAKEENFPVYIVKETNNRVVAKVGFKVSA